MIVTFLYPLPVNQYCQLTLYRYFNIDITIYKEIKKVMCLQLIICFYKKSYSIIDQIHNVSYLIYLPSPFLTMLLSSTFSPSSIVLPDLTRVANSSVPGNRRNSPISLKNSCPPPT